MCVCVCVCVCVHLCVHLCVCDHERKRERDKKCIREEITYMYIYSCVHAPTNLCRCVIAELFMDGRPLFDLSQLLEYYSGEKEATEATLKKISDRYVRVSLLIVYYANWGEPERAPHRRVACSQCT